MNPRTQTLAAVLAVAVFLSACGGGGGGAGAGGTIGGTVVKGPVGGASVTAFAIAGGTKGMQVGTASTDSSGSFRMAVGDYAGPLMIEAHGGTYADEATGATMAMLSADDMVALIPSVTSTTASEIRVTPLTTMAGARARSMAGGMTPANIAAANAAVGTYFSVSDILHVMPMDPTLAGSTGSAGQDARNYGMVLAAMSQYANAIGMTTSSSGIVTAMADDASDGVMDGMMASTSISMSGMGGMGGGTMSADAGTSGLSAAMAAFIGSAMNKAGVTLADMQALMSQLATSGGQLAGTGGGAVQGTMSGSAFMGAMSSGVVTAHAVTGGAMGTVLGTASLDASGHFTVSLGGYSGPVMLNVTDGSFMDPASGTTMTMGAGDLLTSCLPSFDPGSTTTGVEITPLTSMAQAMANGMAGGMTAANIAAAAAAVGSYFMAGDILGTAPMDPTAAGSATGVSAEARNAGMTIAAMSEYAKTIGMSGSSSAMTTAFAQDASDGVMNGMMGATAISLPGMGGMMGGGMMSSSAGTTGLASAMSTFVGAPENRSGVTASDMQALVDKLAASSGAIQ